MTEKYIYPEPLIEEIISKNDIVDTVSRYVKIDRKGKDYFGLCPFHSEKTPSFSVVPAKQIYYCFGCNKGGNVINFIRDIENLTYGEAVRMLAERANITIPVKNSYVDEALLKKEKRVYEMNAVAARFFFDNMKSNRYPYAHEYLASRKIKNETIALFGIGYAPDNWNALTDHLVSKGFTGDEIYDGGLASKSKKDIYDRFRNRIIFPIIDIRNRVIGFGGRALVKKDVKYINSPETCVYKKNRSLYAMNIAKNSRQDFVIIVEGYMDCIMLHQAGFSNTIASLGTALTENQARMIKRIFSQVVIAFDNDAAGTNAAVRGLDILAAMGCVVKVLILPEKDSKGEKIKDPDDFLRLMGHQEFENALKDAMMLVEYKAFLLKNSNDLSTSEGMIAFLKGIAQAISQVASPVERDVYIRNISKKFNADYDALLKEVQTHTKETTKRESYTSRVQPAQKIVPSLMDTGTILLLDRLFYSILVLLCNIPSLSVQVQQQLLDENMIHSDYAKELVTEIIEKINLHENPDEAKVASMLDDTQRSLFIKQAAQYQTISDPHKAFDDYVNKYRHDLIVSNNNILVKALSSDGISEQEKENLQDDLRKNTALLAKYKING